MVWREGVDGWREGVGVVWREGVDGWCGGSGLMGGVEGGG